MKIKSIIDSIFSFFNWKLGIGERWSHILTSAILGLASSLVIAAIISIIYLTVPFLRTVPTDKQIFDISVALFNARNYKGAIEKSELLIKDHPNSRYVQDASYNIGAAHTNLQNYAGARDAYKKLLEEFPESKLKEKTRHDLKALLILEATALFKGKKYDQAYQEFVNLANNEELEEYSDLQARATNYVTWCLLRLGKYDDSIEHANSFLDQFPESELAATALMISAELNYKLKRNYEQSLLKFQKVIEQFPQSDYIGNAAVGVILSLRKLNRDDEVQNQFKLLSEQFSKNEWIAVLKSYAEGLKQAAYSLHDIASWEQAQAQKQARDAFKEVLESELTFLDLKGDARYNTAQSYLDEKKYAQAFIEFDTIVTEEFSSWPKLQEKAMYQAAYCLKQQSIYDEALSRYLEFINRFPDSEYVTDVYFDRGKIYAEKSNKNYDLARFNYNLALKRTVDSNRKAEIHFAFARTYYDEGAYENAILEYDKWLSNEEYLESDSTIKAKHLIANAHYLQGDLEKNWEKTVKAYQRVIDEHGETKERVSWWIHGSPEAPNRIALCSYRIGDIYNELSTQHSEETLAIKDWKEALSRYEKIIDEYPTDDVAPYALYGALLVRMKLESIEKKANEIRAVALTQKAEEYIDKLRKANADEILLAEAQRNFAHMQREELQDYKGAAAEYKKLWDNYMPRPDLTLNLIKLQGKYYEAVCYEKDLKSENSVKSIEAYQEAIMLFEAVFQSLIDTPNIDVPYRDHYISTALWYAGLANYELGKTIGKEEPADKAVPYFKEALRVFESLLADYPKNQYIKEAEDKIKELRQKLRNEPVKSEDLNSSEKSQTKRQATDQDIADIGTGATVFIELNGTVKYDSGRVVDDQNIGSGSGFFVTPNQIATNYIATNYHVISPRYYSPNRDDDKENIVSIHPLRGTTRLVGTDRKYAIIGYTAIDADRDLAILKVRAFGVDPLILGDSGPDAVKQGTPVYPIGNPLGLVNVVSDGKISSVQWVETIRGFLRNRSSLGRDVQQNNTPHKLLMMTAPISPGNSGGPVLNNRGEVIGVSVGYKGGGQNLNYAVPVNDLKALLRRVGPSKPLSDLEIVY